MGRREVVQRTLSLVCLALVALSSQGCLGWREYEVKWRLLDDPNQAAVELAASDFYTSASATDEAEEDAETLLNWWLSDSYLLEMTEEGFYVKSRNLWTEEGLLMAFQSSLCADLSSVEVFSTTASDSTPYRLLFDDLDFDGQVISTNGEITVTSDGDSVITWPAGCREFRYHLALEPDSPPSIALLPLLQKLLRERGLPEVQEGTRPR